MRFDAIHKVYLLCHHLTTYRKANKGLPLLSYLLGDEYLNRELIKQIISRSASEQQNKSLESLPPFKRLVLTFKTEAEFCRPIERQAVSFCRDFIGAMLHRKSPLFLLGLDRVNHCSWFTPIKVETLEMCFYGDDGAVQKSVRGFVTRYSRSSVLEVLK